MITRIVVFLLSATFASALPNAERLFFQQLCTNTNIGSQTVGFADWCNETLPICSWGGVQCSSSPEHVIKLALNAQRTQFVTGQLPLTFAPLTELEEIRLIRLATNVTLSANLVRNNAKLTSLDIQNVPVSGPFSFDFFPASITFLELLLVGVEGPMLGDVLRLSSLEYFIFGFAPKITGTIPEDLFRLPSLKLLAMGTVPFRGSVPSSICTCTIESITLESMFLTDRPTCIASNPVIQECSLTKNLFCEGRRPEDGRCTTDVDPVGVDDQCFVCAGNGQSCVDCQSVPFGTTTRDVCGVCGGSETIVSNCPQDCAGVAGGTSVYDVCFVCNGDGSSCRDCTGIPGGSFTYDICDVCGGNGGTCRDCLGVSGGTSRRDVCDVCNGDGSTCRDCRGVSGGTSVYDICDVCNGDGTTCSDCAGTPRGTFVYDRCDICGGDNTRCDLELIVDDVETNISLFTVLLVAALVAFPVVFLCVVCRRSPAKRGAVRV